MALLHSPRGAVLDRTLPHDLDAEQSVLGSILLHNDGWSRIAGLLTVECFYRQAHQHIYAALAQLLDRAGGVADLMTVKDVLSRRAVIDEVSVPYLASLVDGVPRSTNVEHYAGIVKEKWRLRQLIDVGNRLVSEAYEAAETSSDLLSRHDHAVLAMQQGHGTGLQPVSAHVGRLLHTVEHASAHPGQLLGHSTGFPSLDQVLCGLAPGLIVLGARPSMGKTSLALNIATHGERYGDVLIYSLEQSRSQLAMRLLAARSGVGVTVIRRGWLSETSLGRVDRKSVV